MYQKPVAGSNNTHNSNDIIVVNTGNEANQIKLYKQVIPVSIYHFYIIGEIDEPDAYLELINTLKSAEEQDTIFICLNTPGGNLHTSVQIISAIKQSAATVITVLEGEVCSAGTLIFLAGHKYVVNDFCTFMIHNYSHSLGGKGHEVLARVEFFKSYFDKLAKELYKDFLTDDEFITVANGTDLWLDSDQVRDRLNKRAEKLANINTSAEPVLDAAVIEPDDLVIQVKPKQAKR